MPMKAPYKRKGTAVIVYLEDDVLGLLDKFRFENYLPSRKYAIEELLRRGLAAKAPGRKEGKR